jgi:hypothetical protein
VEDAEALEKACLEEGNAGSDDSLQTLAMLTSEIRGRVELRNTWEVTPPYSTVAELLEVFGDMAQNGGFPLQRMFLIDSCTSNGAACSFPGPARKALITVFWLAYANYRADTEDGCVHIQGRRGCMQPKHR